MPIIPSKCEYLWQQFEDVKRCRHENNRQFNMKMDGMTEGFCTEDKCPLITEHTPSKCEHQWDDIEPIECIICGISRPKELEED